MNHDRKMFNITRPWQRHDIQYYDTQHNDTLPNGTQRNDKILVLGAVIHCHNYVLGPMLTAAIYERSEQASAFVSGKPIHPNVTFVSEVSEAAL